MYERTIPWYTIGLTPGSFRNTIAGAVSTSNLLPSTEISYKFRYIEFLFQLRTIELLIQGKQNKNKKTSRTQTEGCGSTHVLNQKEDSSSRQSTNAKEASDQ